MEMSTSVDGAHEEKMAIASSSSTSKPDREDERVCRICLSDEDASSLIKPCKCDGSSRFVHRSCLDQWRSSSSKAFSTCTTCNFTYRIKTIHVNVTARQLWTFRLRVFRDLVALLALVCAVVLSAAFLISFHQKRILRAIWIWDFNLFEHYSYSSDIGSGESSTRSSRSRNSYWGDAGDEGVASDEDAAAHVLNDPAFSSFKVSILLAVGLLLLAIGVLAVVAWALGLVPPELVERMRPRCQCRGVVCVGPLMPLFALGFMVMGVFAGMALAALVTKRVIHRHWDSRWLKSETERFPVIDLHGKEVF